MIEILQSLGLRENEAKVYVSLLQLGTTHAGRVVYDTKLAKSSVYNALEYLIDRGLVNKYVHSGTAKFSAEDPSKLEYLMNKELQEVKRKNETLQTILPDLYGVKNEHIHMPKVRMYQGEEGISTVLEDTLSSKEDIYTYVSVESMESNIKQINDAYVARRIEKGIVKKALVEDTDWSRSFLASYDGMEVSEVRFLPKDSMPFHTEVNIYDGKVGFLTYRKDEKIGVIIEDQDIYQVHRSTFEALWNTCK